MQFELVNFDSDYTKRKQKTQKKSEKALLTCWQHFETEVKKQMNFDSYDLGNLAGSINTRKINSNTVEVGTNLLYWLVREEGREPGKFPNLDALVGWTARKGMHHEGKTEEYKKLTYKAKWVVFVVARAIATNGTKGQRTFKKTLAREKDNIFRLFTHIMNE